MGEMLHIVAKNGGWWMAVKISNPTERGWAPSNYLSIVNEVTGELEKVQVTPRTQAGQVRPETMAGSAALLSARPTDFPPTNGKPLLYAVKALHKFQATQSDGLSFEQGEVLSIIGMKDGWLRSVNKDGKEGWVPSNYTKQIEGSENASAGAGSTPSKSVSIAEGEEDAGEGEGAAPKTLKAGPQQGEVAKSSAPTEPYSSASAAPAIPADSVPSSPRPDLPPLDANMTPRVDLPTPRAPELPTDAYVATPRGSASGTDTPEEEYRDQVGDLLITPRMAASIGQQTEKVRAMFNFDAKKPDHLSFKKGDIMIVIKKKAGWWKVHHEGFSGKLGYIPSNYVQPLVSVSPLSNPTSTLLTAAGGVITVPAEFEPTKERPLLVKASHTYKAMANNQLSFTKHDLLHVISKNKGWWKAYRVEDSEKIGYVPSNYVKVYLGGDVPKEGEGSLAHGAATAAAAAAGTPAGPVEMEEIGVALHDLDKKDPKILVLKRDDRFLILDKAVGGGWWRCVNLATGEMALAPSNFLRVEIVPKRQPPSLPPPRGTVPNQSTMFVEGTYDFTAKKPSQLSYKKYDSLVILKKDGSWWKARNKMGRVGQIPFNYVKEVFPDRFQALFPFTARTSDELTLRAEEIVTVIDMEQPGWWLVKSISGGSSGTGQGYVPSTHLHPMSTRLPGQVSAPPTPRSAIEPEVPQTPRNHDGTLRPDAPVSATAVGGAEGVVGGVSEVKLGQPLTVEIGSASAQAQHFSGTVLPQVSQQFAPSTAEVVNPVVASKVASVVLPAVHAASPSATPRPEFMHEKAPIRKLAPAAAPITEGRSSAPTPVAESPSAAPAPVEPVTPVDAAPAAAAESATPVAADSATPAAAAAASIMSAGNKLAGMFNSILPSSQPKEAEPAPYAASSPPPAAAEPAAVQVEGQPNAASSSSSSPAPAGSPTAQPSFAFYEGEGESSTAEGSNDLPSRVVKTDKVEESKTHAEIGGSDDPRTKSQAAAGESNNRGACSGGWSNFFGVFGACTGANREATNIPKPGETNYEEKQETK